MASRDEVIRFILEITGDERIAAAAKVMLEAGDAGDAASSEFAKFGEELSTLADQIDAVRRAISLKAELADLQNQFEATQQRAKELSDSIGQAGASSDEVRKAFRATDAEAARLTEQYAKQDVALQRVLGGLQKAGIDTNNLAQANQSLRDKASGVAERIQQTATAAQGASKNLKAASAGARQLGDESKRSGGLVAELKDNLGKIVSVAAAVKLALTGIRIGTEGFTEAANLEESLSRIEALAGEAQRSVASFEGGVAAAAEQAGVSANMAAAAMAALVQQGRSVDDALSALVPTLLLAKTAQLDVAQAAQVVDSALSQFGARASDAGRFVDILVTASKGSKDGLQGLADGIGKVAPLARELNLTFEDTVGILGFMTRNGLSAGDATKGLGAIFRDLADPASKLSQELFALGDSSNSFDKAIETLAGAGQRGKDAMLELDAGTRRVLLFLTQQGVPALDAFRKGLQNVDGAASQLDKALSDNLKGAFDDFSRAFDAIGAQLAQPVLEPLKKELQVLAERLNAFAKSPSFGELKAAIGDLARHGIEAIDSFLRGVDWDGFVSAARTALETASASIAEFKDDLSGVAAVLNTVGSVVGTVFRSIAALFDVVKAAIANKVAESAAELATLSAAVDKLSGSTSQATIMLESLRDSAGETTRGALGDLARNAGALKDNLLALGGAGEAAGRGIRAATAGAREAARATDDVGTAVEVTAEQLEKLGQVGPPTYHEAQLAALDAAGAADDHARALRNALDAVNSTRAKLDELTRSGAGNAEQFLEAQRAYEAARRTLAQLQGQAEATADGAVALKTAFATLGVVAQNDLAKNAETASTALETIFAAFQSGAAKLDDVKAAFDSYAQKQLDAVRNSESWKQAEVRNLLEVKAAALGLTDVKLPDFSEQSGSVDAYRTQVQGVAAANREVIDTSTTASRAIEDCAQATDAARQPLQGFTLDLSQFSSAAISAYAAAQDAALKFGTSNEAQLHQYVQTVNDSNRQITQTIADQRAAVDTFVQTFGNLTDAQLAGQAQLAGGYDALLAQVQGVIASTQDATGAFSLLNDADLGRLRSAAAAVEQQLQSVIDRANQGRQALADMASGLRDQLDQINGNQKAVEDRQFQQTLARIKAEAEANGNLNSAEYADAVNAANALHAAKLKQIADEAAARAKSDADAAQRALDNQRKQANDANQLQQTNTPQRTTFDFKMNGVDLATISDEQLVSFARRLANNQPAILALLKAITGQLRTSARATGLFTG